MNGELTALDFWGTVIAALAALITFVWMPLQAVAGAVLFSLFGESPAVVGSMWVVSVAGTVLVALLLVRAK